MNNDVLKEIYEAKPVIEECLPDDPGRILTTNNFLSDGVAFYKIKLLDNELCNNEVFSIRGAIENNGNNNKFTPSEGVAYLKGEYYYLYRGKLDDYSTFEQFTLEPGIYQTSSGEYIRIDPESEEEKRKYYYSDKILNMDANELLDAINNKSIIIRLTPDKAHSTIPDITSGDDMLKRAIKLVLKDKDIDIDSYKPRFINKNELFNLKQVLRSNKPITIFLFDRYIHAGGLKYTIIIEESGKELVGRPLSGPIIVSMDDILDWENCRIKVYDENDIDNNDNENDDDDN